ncbi:MAG: heme o synthase [Terrimicrobiaceae bacterium]|nr:heme o synthase [Terrimicrobiaceae bacterium]
MKAEAAAAARQSSLLADLAELSKARLSAMVLLTTAAGFLLGWRGPLNWTIFGATLAGTALCAAGASALNQWIERLRDGMMRRTRLRPLPAGRLAPADALLFGLLTSGSGLAILWLFTQPRAAYLAFATIAIYVAVYTPLKTLTTLNTQAGAVPGALPPLIGWVAARGSYDLEGCLLFALLWFWQMPHFLAIAWIYREDYARAGFVMLPARDPGGEITARQAVLYCAGLVAVSLLPAAAGFQQPAYAAAALVAGGGFLAMALRFLASRSSRRARSLFLASVIYLPLMLLALLAFRK